MVCFSKRGFTLPHLNDFRHLNFVIFTTRGRAMLWIFRKLNHFSSKWRQQLKCWLVCIYTFHTVISWTTSPVWTNSSKLFQIPFHHLICLHVEMSCRVDSHSVQQRLMGNVIQGYCLTVGNTSFSPDLFIFIDYHNRWKLTLPS